MEGDTRGDQKCMRTGKFASYRMIHLRQRNDSLSHYSGDLLFVGINYDEKKKEHICRSERVEK